MPEYRLHSYYNPGSKYKHVVIKSYPGFFDYAYCTKADAEAYKDDLPKLYRMSRNNR